MKSKKYYGVSERQYNIQYSGSLVAPHRKQLLQYGEFTYGKPGIEAVNWPVGVTVGKFCSIADGVKFLLDIEHRMDWVTTFPFPALANFPEAATIVGHPYAKGEIIVGNDVWIGKEAMIFSGVTVGDGAVLGARAVVTKDVAPYAIVAGNPAKEVRKRFSDEVIEKLLAISWWNWPIEDIRKSIPFLCSDNIASFIAYAQEKQQARDDVE